MDNHLLVTKFYTPALRANPVRRARLTQIFDRALAQGQRVILVAAPAGFGKTTLVAEWVSQNGRAATWLSLDQEDNDPARFFNVFIGALQRIDPRIGQAAQEAFGLPQPLVLSRWMSPLINDLTTLADNLTLILDDYHLITQPTIHESLGFFIDHLPPAMRVIILTREDPPLPLGRWRARDQIVEIQENDLRFTLDETQTFFRETMNLALAAESVTTLEAQTEGWAAGLQLAGLALRGNQTLAASFAGDNRYIVDYLATEVVQQQPQIIRDFLRQTCILDQFDAAICSALTGQADSQAILDTLENANLFLIPLDQQRAFYRYHRLFGEFLRSTLSRAEANALHRKAMEWYADKGAFKQAIQHALACGALDAAENFVLQVADEILHSGELLRLKGWLLALPQQRLLMHPQLAAYMGWISLIAGDMPSAELYAAQGADNPTNGLMRLLEACIALTKGDYEVVIAEAEDALHLLTAEQEQWRITVLWVMAEAQERAGRIGDTINSLLEAQKIGQRMGSRLFPAIIEAFLASALNENGRRREAVESCQQALVRYMKDDKQPPALTTIIFGRLAVLEYEANRLDEAQAHYEQFEMLRQLLPTNELDAFSQGIRARILAANGQIDEALVILQAAQTGLVPTAIADTSWLGAEIARMQLKQGDIHGAIVWADGLDNPEVIFVTHLRVDEHLSYVRCLLAENRLALAEEWLVRLEDFGQRGGMRRRLLTVHVLQALAAEYAGHTTRARDRLTLAVRLAAGQDYLRAFLDEDARVLTILAGVRHLAPGFVDAVLNAARVDKPNLKISAQPLVEPLSDRELEVLRLIAAGLSNAEIAERLVIAEGTVKRHINHIYGKLEVGSRTQAIVKATELSLLG